MSLKILNSKDLYNPFILRLQLSHTEQKTQENVYNTWKVFYFSRYQEKQKQRQTPTEPTNYSEEKIVEGGVG